MWITSIGSAYIVQDEIEETLWGYGLIVASLATSMAVNTLVTGLIVFRIFKVFRAVKDSTTSHEKSAGVTGGNKLRSVIFVIIESGMALFAVQLIRLVVSSAQETTEGEVAVAALIVGIHEMLNVIISISQLLYITDKRGSARV
jgi:hypothetical protein